MKLKKTISMLVLAAFAATSMVGCGGNTDTSDANNENVE